MYWDRAALPSSIRMPRSTKTARCRRNMHKIVINRHVNAVWVVAIAVCALWACAPICISAQPNFDNDVLLDAACPRSFIGRGNNDAVSMRFLPFEGQEFQINLTLIGTRKARIEVCRALEKSILLQFEEIWSTEPSLSLSDAVSRIKLERYSFESAADAGIQNIRSQLAVALGQSVLCSKRSKAAKEPGTALILLDPDVVEVLYLGDINVTARSPVVDHRMPLSRKNPPIVRQMFLIRKQIEKLANARSKDRMGRRLSGRSLRGRR